MSKYGSNQQYPGYFDVFRWLKMAAYNNNSRMQVGENALSTFHSSAVTSNIIDVATLHIVDLKHLFPQDKLSINLTIIKPNMIHVTNKKRIGLGGGGGRLKRTFQIILSYQQKYVFHYPKEVQILHLRRGKQSNKV